MQTFSSNFLLEQDIPWEPAGESVVRQILGYDDKLMLVKVRFEAGAKGYLHSHPHSQATMVVSGRFAFTIGEESREVKAGDGLYMQPDVPHGCECLEAGELLDCFSPIREDFLRKG